MLRFISISILGLLAVSSCERCMTCTYSYTETTIVSTPDGEEEEVVEYTDLILLDENGESFGEECIKKSDTDDGVDFTIDTYYDLESQTTELDNFEYQCVEL